MDNLLQGLGVFACVGALLLAAVVFFAFRALTRSRDVNRPVDRDEPTVFNQQGTERPRYDTREVESRGGFGGVPQTGTSVRDRDEDVRQAADREIDRSFDRERDLDRDRHVDRPVNPGGGLPPLDDDPDRPRTRDRDQDDDVRSSGGFGG